MDFKTLDKKTLDESGYKYVMVRPTVVFNDFVETIAEHTVTLSETGRLDLISIKYYEDANYVDYILKWNKISNPFAIQEGDVLLIPSNASALKTLKPIKLIAKSTKKISIRDQFLDTKRLPVKDAKRIEYLQRKAAQKLNGSKQIVPPNILKEGDVNITIGNGTITI